MSVEWSWQRAADSLPILIDGFTITVLATVLGMAIASVLGLVIAIARRTCCVRASSPALDHRVHPADPARRPTPVRVLPASAIFRAADRYRCSGCPLFDVYGRGVPRRNRSGSRRPVGGCASLSLPTTRTWRAVVLPQAVRATLPALGNYAISMFKDTPFLFAITVVELVTAAQQYGARTFQYLEPITMAGVIFLLASYPTSVLIRQVEKRLAY